MVEVKEHDEEYFLQQKVAELEKQLFKTKEKLKQDESYIKELEATLQQDYQTKKSKTITIKSANKIEFISVDSIVCCRADEAYTHVYLMDDKIVTAARTLRTFDELLEPHNFFRISKSSLVNTNHIVTFFKDRNQILLKGDILLDVARRRRVEFLKMLD